MSLKIDKREPVFLVLEARWSEKLEDRASVQPFIHGLCDVYGWEHLYRVFDSVNDVKLWLGRFGRMRRVRRQKILYLACHGEHGALQTLEEKIPVPDLLKILVSVPGITGVHLGCCDLKELANQKVIQSLFKKSKLSWIAGYSRSIPWMESTVVDLLFWNWMFAGLPRGERSIRLHPIRAAEKIYDSFDLAREFGFHVMSREPGICGFACSWERWKKKN